MQKRFANLFATLVLTSPVLLADSPSQFRGPAGNGVFSDSVPNNWDADTNVRWSVDIPGGGWSSPVSTNDRIFVTTAIGEGDSGPKGFGEGTQSMGDFYRSAAPARPYSFEVHCLSTTDGSLIWKKPVTVKTPPYKIHPSNSYATESPVTDGDHVCCYFAAVGVVACLDKDGQEIWKRELGAFKTGNDFGTGSSLAIHESQLFVQCDNEQDSFVCALDTRTGEDVWRDDREGTTSWASPIIWKNAKRTELVTCGSGTVTSYEPASGRVLWRLTGTGGAYSASPTFDAARLYLGQSGRNSRGPLVAINAGASGDMTLDDIGEDKLAWVVDTSAPGMCSPVIAGGHVYVLSRGILSCHDAETGDRVYRERLDNSSSVTASLWAAGDQVFSISESGDTAVVQAGKDFSVSDVNKLEGLFWSTPSQTDSTLLIRSANRLYCIAN